MLKVLSIDRQRRKSLRRYLGLVMYMTYTDLRAESARTYAGFLWWVAEPLASLTVYYIVFGLVLVRPIENYVAFLFVGLVPWRWLQTTLLHGSVSILSAKGLMRRVHLPKVIFPIVVLLSNSFKFALVFLLVVLFVWVSGFPMGVALLCLPGVLAAQGLLLAAGTLLAAAVTPFFPDLRIVLENVIRLWFFLSGIFFDINAFGEPARSYFRLNPMAVVLDGYREILLRGAFPDPVPLVVISAVSLGLCFIGGKLIRRNDFLYPKLAL